MPAGDCGQGPSAVMEGVRVCHGWETGGSRRKGSSSFGGGRDEGEEEGKGKTGSSPSFGARSSSFHVLLCVWSLGLWSTTKAVTPLLTQWERGQK